MGREPAKCGTDAGYFRHRRTNHEEPCDDCRTAHAAATRRSKDNPRPKKTCACGRPMRHSSVQCGRCKKSNKASLVSYSDTEDDPKRPIAWRPNRRGIQVPVYKQSEVA